MCSKKVAALVAVLLGACLFVTRAMMLRGPRHAALVGMTLHEGPAATPQAQTGTAQNSVHSSAPNPSAISASTNGTTSAASPASSGEPEAAPTPDGSGWKTYSSSEYGFEIRYPADWSFNNNYENNYGKPPTGKRPSGFAGETRNLFSLETHGPNQPEGGGGEFADGAVVTVKITGTKGVIEDWTLTNSRPWYLITSTPEDWVKLESSLLGGNHLEHIKAATNAFTGEIEVAHDDSNPEKIWGEAGGAYFTFPNGRVLLISWERMNVANSLSYQEYFLPMLASLKPLH